MEYRQHKASRGWLHVLTAPFIWLPLPFILALDFVCALYQFVCFPVYGIKRVKRSKHILILDRNKLDYLNGVEKLGCMYCGYANGVLLYLKEIAGLTEKYWCGIKHEERPGFKTQEDQVLYDFAEFGDANAFKEKYNEKIKDNK